VLHEEIIQKINFEISQIDKNLEVFFPKSEKWHKDLLIQMMQDNKKRKAVLSQDLSTMLLKYLNFRHFQRNAYEYILDWNKLKPLFLDMKNSLAKFKQEIKDWIEKN